MNGWIKTATGLLTIVAAVVAFHLYFAKEADLQTLKGRLDRSEINAEMVFTQKMLMMLEERCGPTAPDGRCRPRDKVDYEEALLRLEELRDEKAMLGK